MLKPLVLFQLLRPHKSATKTSDPSQPVLLDSDDTKLKILVTDEDSLQLPSEEAFLLIVHENVSSIVEDVLVGCSRTLRLTDIVLVQDDCYITPIHDLLRCTDLATLSALYVVDCRPQLEEDDIFVGVRLKTLVLSNTHLRRLPTSLFLMDCLEVLKVDRNSLEEVPEDLVRLKHLLTFCCDRQAPRLRLLPNCIGKMNHIQVNIPGNLGHIAAVWSQRPWSLFNKLSGREMSPLLPAEWVQAV